MHVTSAVVSSPPCRRQVVEERSVVTQTTSALMAQWRYRTPVWTAWTRSGGHVCTMMRGPVRHTMQSLQHITTHGSPPVAAVDRTTWRISDTLSPLGRLSRSFVDTTYYCQKIKNQLKYDNVSYSTTGSECLHRRPVLLSVMVQIMLEKTEVDIRSCNREPRVHLVQLVRTTSGSVLLHP
jgi:hypothetical protein